MNPEEKHLLERTLKLSEENNKMLKRMQRIHRWAVIWGIIKAAVIIIPLVIGYLFLEPYLNEALDNYNNIKGTINLMR